MRYKAPHNRKHVPHMRHVPRFPTQRPICWILAALFIAGFMVINQNLRPVLKSFSTHQAITICTQIANEAIGKELNEKSITYDALVHLSQNKEGGITAIETDILGVDRLKAQTAQSIMTALQAYATRELRIPLGTLMGNLYFTGRGPSIPFRILPSQSASVEIRGEFLDAGINQTLHRLVMDVQMDVDALIPGMQSAVQVTTSYLIAETVIVGTVPGAYTQVQSGADALPNVLADYKAQQGSP